MKNFKTIEDATKEWVGGFNCISQSLIERIIKCDEHSLDFEEVTKPIVGNFVGVNDYGHDFYEITSIDYENEIATIIDGDEKIEVDYNETYLEHDSFLPMWGWLWSFGESIDEEWARENLEVLSECGFRIYEDIYDGILYFGIDGAGYNFYQAHWIPLYKARGLKWHDEKIDEVV